MLRLWSTSCGCVAVTLRIVQITCDYVQHVANSSNVAIMFNIFRSCTKCCDYVRSVGIMCNMLRVAQICCNYVQHVTDRSNMLQLYPTCCDYVEKCCDWIRIMSRVTISRVRSCEEMTVKTTACVNINAVRTSTFEWPCRILTFQTRILVWISKNSSYLFDAVQEMIRFYSK